MRSLFPVLFGALLLVTAAPAWADAPLSRPPLSARLDYTYALNVDGCPSERELRDVLTKHFRYDPIDADGKGLLELRITRRGPKLHAELVAENGGGARWHDTFEKASTCADVVLDAALSLRIAVNFHLPAPPSRAASRPPSPPPARVANDPPPAPPLPAPPPPLLYRISVGPSVAFGLAPGPSLGGGVAFAVRLPWTSFGLGVRGLGSPLAVAADTPTPIRSSLLISTFDACGHVRFFFGCGVLSFGLIHFDAGDTLLRPTTQNPSIVALGLRAGVEWSFAGRFSVRISAEGAPLLTQTRVLLDRREVWKTSVFFASIDAGLSLSL